MRSLVFLYNKRNTFGLRKDVAILRAAMAGAFQFSEADPLENPTACDVAVHLEIPAYGWMPWAQRNILIVNPEWFVADAWKPYLDRFDLILAKDGQTAERLAALTTTPVRAIRWARPPAGKSDAARDRSFVWFLAASQNKRAMVQSVCDGWDATYPNLSIYTTEEFETPVRAPSNVKIYVGDLTPQEHTKYARALGHLAISRAEGYGYTAAEAFVSNSFLVLNNLPVYREYYGGEGANGAAPEGVAFVETPLISRGLYDAAEPAPIDFSATMEQFALFESVSRASATAVGWSNFSKEMSATVEGLAGSLPKTPRYPPILEKDACPPITIITLLYNRRAFFDLACHSIMVSDYPKDKIEWIIVEDSDDPAEGASDRVVAVAEAAAPVRVVYVPLASRTSVAKKRNIGVERATSDIILMMDDDDHYPETSFRRRVAWLTLHPWKPAAVATTTIACYDLVSGVSSVNVPPFDLPLGQRVSEATLTFYKSWWETQPFDETVQVGEGESIVAGRERELLEIPPQQIIVAFSHKKNASSRRTPRGEDLKPGCFWGFPPAFLQFVHGLAGVKLVVENT